MGKNASSTFKLFLLGAFLGVMLVAAPGTGAFAKYFENFKFQGNTISANNTNGDIVLTPNGTGLFTLTDGADPTKKATFDLSGITTGTTHAITLPDDPGQLVTTTATQALSNKFFTAPNVQGYLIIGGTEREIRLFEDGSDHVKVKAPASLDATVTVELPIPYPTVQKFTSVVPGTYTTPAGVRYIKVRMVGGGGGGGSSGTGSFGAASSGSSTTFGTSLLTAPGGGSGGQGGAGAAGGAAGTVNSPAIALLNVPGSRGAAGGYASVAGPYKTGGAGGTSCFGGSGGSSFGGSAGSDAAANSGSGGGGAGDTSNTVGEFSGSGGGAGTCVEAIITNPDASYSYAVGAGGTGGSAGTSGYAGGNGAAGQIIVEEYY